MTFTVIFEPAGLPIGVITASSIQAACDKARRKYGFGITVYAGGGHSMDTLKTNYERVESRLELPR